MRHLAIAVSTLLICPLASAQADYNYLEAHYQSLDPDSAAAGEASGYALRLSAPLEADTFLRVEYGRLKPDQGGGRTTELRGGLGLNTQWQPGVDLYALLSYEERDAGATDENGYGAEAGLRWQAGDDLELNGGGRYRDLDDSGNAKVWFGGLVFTLAPGLALSGRYENDEGFTRWLAGVRFVSR